MRGLGAEQEVGVQVYRRLEPPRRVEPDGDGRRVRPAEIGVHAERSRHVGIGRDVDAPERDRLQRLLGNLPQHGGGPQPDLLACRGALGRARGVAFGAHHVVQRSCEIGIREPVRHDAVHDLSRFPFPVSRSPFPVPGFFDSDDRADPNGGLVRGPEVELVGGRGLQLRGDDVADRRRGRGERRGGGFADHVPVFGSREPGAERRSRGARAFK